MEGYQAASSSGVFPPDTHELFLQHLAQWPNNRRVSLSEKNKLVRWLINPVDPSVKPSSQREYSRRNYVIKAYSWDENSQTLFAGPRKNNYNVRPVITDDKIVEVVEEVHVRNNHSGWDNTWKLVNDGYYGIMRVDVVFLLRLCPCANHPRKRPRSTPFVEQYSFPTEDDDDDFYKTFYNDTESYEESSSTQPLGGQY